MKTTQEILDERVDRLKKTIALEKTDKTPFILMADAFCAKHMGAKLSDMCKSSKKANEIMVNSVKALGEIDGINAAFPVGPVFPLIFMSKVKLPGRELPDDMLWQLDESEMMTHEDYDTILNKGWSSFMPDYLTNRLNVNLGEVMEFLEYAPQAAKNFQSAGYYVYSEIVTITVNEFLSGGRSMSKFMKDLFKMPEKVEEVLTVINNENLESLRQQIRGAKPIVVFVSPARGASEFYSPKLWERFVWKYIKSTADMIIEEGAAFDVHIDSNWERDLDYFKVFPRGKVVFETDGTTDIYKVKEKLGDNLCIKGDVPAGLLALGTPDEVYNYSSRLVRDMGTGFILSCGCSAPPNAKVKNIKAMVSATVEK